MNPPPALLLDTNLLLLWLSSVVDPSLLRNYKRIQMFTSEDIDRLRDIVPAQWTFVSTPQILAETDNFIDSAPSHRRIDLRQALRAFVQAASEIYEPSLILTASKTFEIVGLSDTSLIHASHSALVITTDGKLAALILSQHGNVHLF